MASPFIPQNFIIGSVALKKNYRISIIDHLIE